MQGWVIFRAIAFLILFASSPAFAAVIPQGTPIHVEIERRTAMRIGQKIEAHTVEPIYIVSEIAIPAGCKVDGVVTELTPDTNTRKSARFDGDFTPFRIPVIMFTSLTLPDKQIIPIVAEPATQGSPQVQILSEPAKHQSLARQLWSMGVAQLKDTRDTITAPGKKERLTDFIYGQLPYHPQRIRRDTQWTFDLSAPLEVAPHSTWQAGARHEMQTDPDRFRLHAYLSQSLSSARSNAGERFEAVVTEPLYASNNTVAVPAGSVITGQVTEAQPAKRFARDGKLRFVFRELTRPEQQETIQGNATAAITSKNAPVVLDSEGGFRPAKRNRIVDPVILVFLGTRPLDGDKEGQFGKKTVASNGFGLAGRIVGLASGPPEVATGIGFYGLAVSLYRNYIARGKDVSFARGTRIEVDAVPSHGAQMPIR